MTDSVKKLQREYKKGSIVASKESVVVAPKAKKAIEELSGGKTHG